MPHAICGFGLLSTPDHMTFTAAIPSRLCKALQEEWERVFGVPVGITNEWGACLASGTPHFPD